MGHTHTASAAFEGSTDPVNPSMVMADPADASRSTRVLNDTCIVFCAATNAFDWFISAERKSATSKGAALRAARCSSRGTKWIQFATITNPGESCPKPGLSSVTVITHS